MSFWRTKSDKLIDAAKALPGRTEKMSIDEHHAVSGHGLLPPFPEGLQRCLFGLGCFWGAERIYWNCDGVHVTAVGYAGGFTPNPTYEEVCSGNTGHTEVVMVVYDPQLVSFQTLLKLFWEKHDPTQGMRQGNDRGTQYRSAIFVDDAKLVDQAEQSKSRYQQALSAAGRDSITTEIKSGITFYYAESYHQQYLHKNPNGYCGLGGTGVSFI